jgi:hypothetical protein
LAITSTLRPDRSYSGSIRNYGDGDLNWFSKARFAQSWPSRRQSYGHCPCITKSTTAMVSSPAAPASRLWIEPMGHRRTSFRRLNLVGPVGHSHEDTVTKSIFGHVFAKPLDFSNRLHAGLQLRKREHARKVCIRIISLMQDDGFRANAHQAVPGPNAHVAGTHFRQLKGFQCDPARFRKYDSFRHRPPRIVVSASGCNVI